MQYYSLNEQLIIQQWHRGFQHLAFLGAIDEILRTHSLWRVFAITILYWHTVVGFIAGWLHLRAFMGVTVE